MKVVVTGSLTAGLVVVLVMASAFHERAVASTWFSLDADGNVGEAIASGLTCDGTSSYCAVEVDNSALTSSGVPEFSNVEDLDAAYIQIVRKN